MKKADPFTSIAPVPKSLADHWKAFSHMANHYRKLLNVKPRVNSSLPRSGTQANKVNRPTLSSYLREIHTAPTRATTPNSPGTLKKPQKKAVSAYPISIEDNELKSTSKLKRPSSKSIKNAKNMSYLGSESSMYSNVILYGPSSLKSSVDALGSEYESSLADEPRVETMGVAEKIRAFLHSLHEFEKPSKNKRAKEYSKSKQCECHNKSNIAETTDVNKKSRHAGCFTPSSTPKSVRKPAKSSTTASPIHKPPVKLLSEAISQANKANKTKKTTSMKIDSLGGKGEHSRRQVGGGSIISVGTIRGSEELTAEETMLLLHNKETSSSVPKKLRERKSRTRTPSAGYCSQSLSGKATATSLSSTGGVQHLSNNNKDSSRDSAYGFSSGESRPTRESTPEKLAPSSRTSKVKIGGKRSAEKKYKSALSTVASSVNLDINSGDRKDRQKTIPQEASEDRYLDFLTEVTNDIVSRGIYTNRGLKSLFQEHLGKHRNVLDPTRMKEMLDKLRMDLGIPKDDSLNSLEFGYGSILNATASGKPESIGRTIPSKAGKSQDLDEMLSDEFIPPIPYPTLSHRNRPTLEGRKEQNDSGSEIDHPSDTSLSENEVKKALKEVGIDSSTTLEIVSMMKYKSSFPSKGSFPSSDDSPSSEECPRARKPKTKSHTTLRSRSRESTISS